MKKKRLDLLLTEKGLTPSREKAQRLIMAGNVLVNDEPVTKSGVAVAEDAAIRIRGDDCPYVSRAGLKLAAALKEFGVNPSEKTALDVGASTGGFTDVLLQGGAQKVFAVDVGHDQLDWKIRNDPRVVTFEDVNARHLKFEQIGQQVDLIVIDVSFISLKLILPALKPFAAGAKTDWIALVKPQFEIGKGKVGKGGIVRSPEDHQKVLETVREFAESFGLHELSLIESPILGAQGNKEFLVHWKLDFIL